MLTVELHAYLLKHGAESANRKAVINELSKREHVKEKRDKIIIYKFRKRREKYLN